MSEPVQCDRCVSLGDASNEDGARCHLFWCTCVYSGPYVLVASDYAPMRVVSLETMRLCNPDSPTPQMEAVRRAEALGLIDGPEWGPK